MMKIEAELLHAMQRQDVNYCSGKGLLQHSHRWSRLRFLILQLLSVSCLAQAAVTPPILNPPPVGKTTLAVFNKQPISDDLWQALVLSLREELASGSSEIQELAAKITGKADSADADSQIQILRGDEIMPGLAVDNSVTVYLEGECSKASALQFDLPGRPQHWESSVLGWVNMKEGRIDPFIHVDCRRIGQMLWHQEVGHSSEQRDQLIANAIARVILHEWIHVATQNPHHSRHGIAQAQFGVAELMIHSPKPPEQPGMQLHANGSDPKTGFAEPAEINSLPQSLNRSAK